MSTPYRASSLARRAVLRSGLPDDEVVESMRVLTFHDAKVSFICFFCFWFRPQRWVTRQPRQAGQVEVEQAMFRAPFLAPSSGYGGKQSCPKEGCLVTQGAAELHCCSKSEKSDHMA